MKKKYMYKQIIKEPKLSKNIKHKHTHIRVTKPQKIIESQLIWTVYDTRNTYEQ